MDEALFCYKKSLALLLEEYYPSATSNRGYAYYWIGETLQNKGNVNTAYCFFRQAYTIWEKISPPRAEKASIKLLNLKGTSNVDLHLLTLNSNQIEKRCNEFAEQ
jgi:hypothetical protein